MLTNKDYCDYDTCVALMEIGYNAPQRLIPDYFGVFEEPQYDEKIHIYEAQKWLREEHNLHIDVRLHGIIGYQCEVCTSERTITVGREFLTYEEALLEGLRKAIEILKEK